MDYQSNMANERSLGLRRAVLLLWKMFLSDSSRKNKQLLHLLTFTDFTFIPDEIEGPRQKCIHFVENFL